MSFRHCRISKFTSLDIHILKFFSIKMLSIFVHKLFDDPNSIVKRYFIHFSFIQSFSAVSKFLFDCDIFRG